MINLTNILDYFIVDSIKNNSDEKLLLKSRILVGVTLMYFSSLVSLVLVLLIMAYLNTIVVWSGAISSTLSSCCYLFQIIYFKKTGNHFIASSITMSTLLCFTTAFTYLTGGWNSPLILFLFVVPMCAFLITGYKAGTFWSVLVIAAYAMLGLLEYAGIQTPHVIDKKYEVLLAYFSWMFSWTMIVGGVTLYSSIMNSLNSSINSEKEKLRLNATFDEESGAYTRKAFKQLLVVKAQTPTVSTKFFALVFMELVPDKESMKKNTREILGIFLEAIRNRLGDQIILSRYSSLSITAMISEQANNESARSMLLDLYHYLQQTMDQHGVTLYFGGVVAQDNYNKIDSITTDARNALLDAKRQQQQFVIYSKGEQKINNNNYLSHVVVATFDQITKKV